MKKESGVVKIHGKEYKTVALRVSEFREKYPISDGWSIQTFIIDADAERVVMCCKIFTGMGVIVATGFSEETRTDRGVNSTSAMENAETSAIGRALAAAGFGGSEYASANEVQGALAKQSAPKPRQQPQRNPVKAANDDLIPEGRGSKSAPDPLTADIRAGLEGEGDTLSLLKVRDAAIASGLYKNEYHAWNAIKKYDFPEKMGEVTANSKVTRAGALKVFDWLMERKQSE